MVALSLRKKKKMYALDVLTVILDKNVDENTDRKFLVRKISHERKRYSLYYILTNELLFFDREYFFRLNE